MPRGGRRQGTPGRGYANRTDLALDPNMAQNTAASGGMAAPVQATPQGPVAAAPQMFPYATPDDSPNLTTPSERPDEPVTAGIGSLSTQEMMRQEAGRFKEYLPMLTKAANMTGAPESFVRFVRYLRDAQ